jgi:hypothetical protein
MLIFIAHINNFFKMKNKLLIAIGFCLLLFLSPVINAQTKLDSLLPVRGFCIAAPNHQKCRPVRKIH